MKRWSILVGLGTLSLVGCGGDGGLGPGFSTDDFIQVTQAFPSSQTVLVQDTDHNFSFVVDYLLEQSTGAIEVSIRDDRGRNVIQNPALLRNVAQGRGTENIRLTVRVPRNNTSVTFFFDLFSRRADVEPRQATLTYQTTPPPFGSR